MQFEYGCSAFFFTSTFTEKCHSPSITSYDHLSPTELPPKSSYLPMSNGHRHTKGTVTRTYYCTYSVCAIERYIFSWVV